ncbi:hypothetical protein HY797_04065 [Candidatus Falkowbacteria bacterium]|nr:hypothetical protein [Candidatus Falkowbacteria bacterium]
MEISGKSERKIRLIVDHWLGILPLFPPENLASVKHLVFDGTFIWRRKIEAVILLDSERRKMVKGEYGLRENTLFALLNFFTKLRSAGLSPKSATVDGNPTVIKTLKVIWPDIIIQRCLVHIQRQGLMWCRVNPKTAAARKLRLLFVAVTSVNTEAQKKIFLESVRRWEYRHGRKIDSRPESGWVFSDLKRARSMLLKSLPSMFHYLDDSNIPKTTNLAEGYFSFLKSRYRNHRGLSPKKRQAFFQWFFFLKP